MVHYVAGLAALLGSWCSPFRFWMVCVLAPGFCEPDPLDQVAQDLSQCIMSSQSQVQTSNQPKKMVKDRNSEPASLRPTRNKPAGSRSAGNSPASSPRNSLLLTIGTERLRNGSTSSATSNNDPGSPTTPQPSPLTSEKQPPEKTIPAKERCPCKTSSKGKSWLMTCNSCEQAWHNGCANLKGDKLTKDVVNSILKDWQCPWCFVPPFPCPKKHKAAKSKESFKNITQANEFLSTVVDSLEDMVDTKLTEVLKSNTSTVEAIEKQLTELTKSITEFQSRPFPLPPPHQANRPDPPIQHQPNPPIEVEEAPLIHNTNYIEDYIENFISPDQEKEIVDILDAESFTTEGSRGVLQYGQHYKYMGSRTKPKPCPEVINRLMDKLNNDFGSKDNDQKFHYTVNSCLVNKYEENTSVLPEHSDDEGDICPWSSIFTLSLGATRTIVFRNVQSKEETPVFCQGRSLYQMTRQSQDFHKHQMKAEPEQPNGVRYSLTFRAIHWSHFNSTILVGDSNFGKVQFGSGKGKVGQATPGLKCFAPTVNDINPLAYTSYRNIVIMAGTNDLKKEMSDPEILELYKLYKMKITQIRTHSPKARILVCPVLPTKSSLINERVFKFNNYILNDLVQENLKITFVEGFHEFLDQNSVLLKRDLAVNDFNDILHINSTKGVRLLVKLIKQCIFRSKASNVVNGRTYANATRGGPAFPV